LFDDDSKTKKSFFLRDVKQYEVKKNSLNSFVKFSHNEEFIEFNVLNDKLKKELLEKMGTNILDSILKQLKPRGLTSAKFKTLQSLKSSIPEKYRKFYDNLKPLVNDNIKDWDSDSINKKLRNIDFKHVSFALKNLKFVSIFFNSKL